MGRKSFDCVFQVPTRLTDLHRAVETLIDSRVLNQLWEACADRLLLYARTLGVDGEDAVQEAFVKLAGQHRLPTHPLAWLIRVVRNRANDERRRRCVADRHTENIAKSCEWFSACTAERRIAAAELQAALAGVPEQLRECIVLHVWSGLSFEEIAIAMNISSSTAHRRYSEGLGMLRKSLKGGAADV